MQPRRTKNGTGSGAPTLSRVAEAAGVHTSTVSRALDPARRHLIQPEVVRQIEETARLIGYRRNINAAALRTGRSKLIGILLPDIANPVFGPILGGVEEALAVQGYAAIVANAGGSGTRAVAAAELLIARRVEGLVIATAELEDAVVSLCLSEGVPAVLVNRAEAERRTPTIISDDHEGMQLSVRHLVALGHRRISHLAGPANTSTGLWRREGFERAMGEAGLAVDLVAIASGYTREAGETAAAALLADSSVTAIAAANDLLALGACAALVKAGRRCPEDVSVVGYNDMPLIDIVSPPLTSIRINSAELGRAAGEAILAELTGNGAEATVMVRPSLVIRGSTGTTRKTAQH